MQEMQSGLMSIEACFYTYLQKELSQRALVILSECEEALFSPGGEIFGEVCSSDENRDPSFHPG
jgi:hypothetical protein